MNHLDDSTLNAFLDDALDTQAAGSAAAHLAACPQCAARLARLRTTIAEVTALPDLPLGRDLSAGVLAALKTRARPALSPRARLAFGLQALAAAAALTAAAPLALALLGDPSALAPALDVSSIVAALSQQLMSGWLGILSAASAWLAGAGSAPLPAGLPVLSGLALGGLGAAAGLLFVVGNGLLLRLTLARPGGKPSSAHG